MKKMISATWFDLCMCALFCLLVFGGRDFQYVYSLLAVVALFRLTITYLLAHREKRTWLPLLIFLSLTIMTTLAGVWEGIS